MGPFLQDVRFATRTLARQPGLVTAAVLTLALGIGANTAIFSLVNSLLLTPPPFREPGQLVFAWASFPELARKVGLPDRLPISNGVFYDWQKESRSFERLSLVRADEMNLTGEGEPEQLGVVRVSGDFFGVLGTPTAVGRTLGPADDAPGKPRAVVLSHGFWQRRFGGDPRVVGRTISLSGNPMTVVGVMPPRFSFPRGSDMPAGYGFAAAPDAWVPAAFAEKDRQNRGSHNGMAIGRLKPGIGLTAAQAELRALCQRFGQTYPDSDKGWSARLIPITEQMVGDVRPALLILWGAVGFVLLIACANVANLLLARAASRQKEIAVRTAIGAGRGRLLAQLLTESVLLALLGGVLGVALAAAGLAAFSAFVPASVAGAAKSLSLDVRVLAFTAALCLLVSLLAGLVPALQMTRPDLAQTLREGTRAGAGGVGSRRIRSVLVVAEVALAVLLLVGAGLLLRSFSRLLAVDPGFRTARILSFRIELPPDRYSAPQRALFFDRLLDRLKGLPGLVAAGAVSEVPMSGTEDIDGFIVEGRPAPKPGEMTVADSRQATPGYFETMGIPLRRGRFFHAGDVDGKQRVAIVDDVMARTGWPDQEAVGKRFRMGDFNDKNDRWITVIGVVGSVRHSGLHADPRPQLYRVEAQAPSPQMYVVARTTGDPRSLVAAATAAVHAVDRDQPLSQVRTLEQVVAESLAARRFNLLLLGLFAGLALALSAVGIYGVTAYSVTQRTREMGLRMALGAQPSGVLRLVVGEAGALVGLGVLVGLAAAFALTRVMASLLYGVGTTDPGTFAAVAVGLTGVALAAAYVPGRKATRVDPLTALRAE
ncbi:MAG TPA: ABC transporter permease [Thermoanaerobaculia bacterium]|nr:ABC transporter permease [Thermoanaerobaculia bacterium]